MLTNQFPIGCVTSRNLGEPSFEEAGVAVRGPAARGVPPLDLRQGRQDAEAAAEELPPAHGGLHHRGLQPQPGGAGLRGQRHPHR